MGAAGALVGGSALLGTGTQIASRVLEERAQHAAINFNIKGLKEQQQQKEEFIREEATRRRSENIVTIAKSGVRRTGSPLEVLAANAAAAEKQIVRGRIANRNKISLLKGQRSQLRSARGLGIASDVLGLGGSLGQSFSG